MKNHTKNKVQNFSIGLTLDHQMTIKSFIHLSLFWFCSSRDQDERFKRCCKLVKIRPEFCVNNWHMTSTCVGHSREFKPSVRGDCISQFVSEGGFLLIIWQLQEVEACWRSWEAPNGVFFLQIKESFQNTPNGVSCILQGNRTN